MNIAKLATLTVSSTESSGIYEKEYAVDGKVDAAAGDIDKCQCCYVSKKENNPYFIARLPGYYQVHQITIIGRQFGGKQNIYYVAFVMLFNQQMLGSRCLERTLE